MNNFNTIFSNVCEITNTPIFEICTSNGSLYLRLNFINDNIFIETDKSVLKEAIINKQTILEFASRYNYKVYQNINGEFIVKDLISDIKPASDCNFFEDDEQTSKMDALRIL